MKSGDDPSVRATRKTRLFFVNRFYAPDLSATSQILTDVAEALSKRAFDVFVFTSRMSYDATQEFNKTETLNGVQVRREWSTRLGREQAVLRSIDY